MDRPMNKMDFFEYVLTESVRLEREDGIDPKLVGDTLWARIEKDSTLRGLLEEWATNPDTKQGRRAALMGQLLPGKYR